MKNPIRKITIGETQYLYIVTSRYSAENNTNTLKIKIFLEGYKATPLVLDFVCEDDYYMGNLLKTGVSLFNHFTQKEEIVNLNEPKNIRKIILLALKKGWDGKNKSTLQNGMNYLTEMGYEIQSLIP